MGLLFLLTALLGLCFPPFAIVFLGMMVLGVFAKGVVADSQEQIIRPRRKTGIAIVGTGLITPCVTMPGATAGDGNRRRLLSDSAPVTVTYTPAESPPGLR